VFGHSYAANGAVPLRLFSLGAIPLCIREHYAAIKRIAGRPAGGTPLVLAGSALKLIFAAKGASMDGLIGLGWGSFLASLIEAAVMAPTVLRVSTGAATVTRREARVQDAFTA
jgi:hypothetical protein